MAILGHGGYNYTPFFPLKTHELGIHSYPLERHSNRDQSLTIATKETIKQEVATRVRCAIVPCENTLEGSVCSLL
jgi:prephenate dehydratase